MIGGVAGNGLIDFDEFMHMMESRDRTQHRSQDAEMRALFAAFDKDDNGYIDGHELKLTMRDVGMDLTNHDIEMMMKAAGVAIKDRIFYEGSPCYFNSPVSEFDEICMKCYSNIQMKLSKKV